MQNGLVAAYLLDGQGNGDALTWEQVNSWSPEQGLLWVHLDFNDNKALDWLDSRPFLRDVTKQSMVLEESRPRCTVLPEGLYLSLRGVNLNPGRDPEDMVSIHIWADENRIITTRKYRLLSINDIRDSLDKGCGPKSAAGFIKMLISRLCERMVDVIDNIEERVDALSDEMLTYDSSVMRSKIAEVRRETILIRRYLAPQREALSKLCTEESPLISSADRIYIREINDRVIRYIEDLDSAKDRAIIAQEELRNKLSELMERRLYTLSIVTVIFLPLSFITGLLGINVAGIPGESYKGAFWIVCTILFLLLFACYIYFKKRKWV